MSKVTDRKTQRFIHLNGKCNEQSGGWEKQRFIHLNGKWNEQSGGWEKAEILIKINNYFKIIILTI